MTDNPAITNPKAPQPPPPPPPKMGGEIQTSATVRDAVSFAVEGYMRDRTVLISEWVKCSTSSHAEQILGIEIQEIDRKVFLLLGLGGKDHPLRPCNH